MKHILFISDESLDAVIIQIGDSLGGNISLESLKLIDRGIFDEEELKDMKYFKVTIEEVPS